MKKIRYGVSSTLIVFLLTFLCTYSFCAVSKKVYNNANVIYYHFNGESPSIDEEYPEGTPVVLPIESNLCMAKGKIIPVDSVFGLKATISGSVVTLSWSPVNRYVDLDNEIQVENYIVYYSTSSGSGYQILTITNSSTLSCTHIVGANSPTYYYRVAAVDDMDNTSTLSLEADISNNIFAYRSDVLTSGDTYTCLFIPGSVAPAIYKGGAGNPYPGEDIIIEVTKVREDEGKPKTIKNVRGLVATSVSFDAYKYTNREKISNFIFPGNVKITLRYEVENGFVKNTTLPAEQAKDKLGLYYFNGLEWIKLPAEINMANQTLTATINHLSKYALISGTSNPTKLTLVNRVPPIFTPNGDHINDYVFFYYDGCKSGTTPKGKIFDLSGSLICELSEQSPGQMKWDGKDSAGNLMESGIYIYQIQAGEEIISGTVVLAK